MTSPLAICENLWKETSAGETGNPSANKKNLNKGLLGEPKNKKPSRSPLKMKKGRMPYLACGPLLLATLLTSCGDKSTPSAEENRQLDNAAELLNSAPDELANIDENGLGPAEDNAINTDESAH